jgi:3D (Asp-Asp-Asp) domain-containing protein
MKKYVTRFVVSLLVCTILINSFINKEYKLLAEEDGVEIETLERFIKEFKVIPEELRIKEEVVIKDIQEVVNVQEHKINSVFEKEEFTVTAYDLSYQSCQKKPSSRGYGITRSGFDLKGHNWRTARVIAVDKDVIPLGSLVYIQFIDENYFKYNSVYLASDTGGAIKGNKIDLFIEDSQETVSKEAIDFGVTKARIIILNKDGGN